MKSLRPTSLPVEFCCDDPNLTVAAGLVTVAELDRVLAIVATIDEQVGSLYRGRARHTPYSAGRLVMGMVESQLAGGDFICDIDHRRADSAGAELRAVGHPPASTTVGHLARRFDTHKLAALEGANAKVVARAVKILPEAERARLASVRPTVDLDPTDVEVYGKKKRQVAFNYAGQRCGRPHPAVWAEAGLVLAADLGSGTDDPRPQAPSLIDRAVAALPGGAGRPIIRADSGFFDVGVAEAALGAGADFGIAAKRNPAMWTAVRAIAEDAWRPADGMAGAEVAVCGYCPAGWPPETRAVARRVWVDAADIRADPRSRRRRTIELDELKAVQEGRADHAYAYVVILTSLEWDPVEVEAWFRDRAQVEERLKDSKLGMALRHLPSGYPAINAVWMWSAFIALNISAVISALANPALRDDAGPDDAETETDDADMAPWHRLRRPDRAHAKRLRREIIMVPGRLAHHARRLIVHLHPSQEAGALLAAYAALVALPSFAPP